MQPNTQSHVETMRYRRYAANPKLHLYEVLDAAGNVIGEVGPITPYHAYGNTYRWRAWFDGKFLDIERRRDFERVYNAYMTK